MNGRVYDPKLGRFLQADPFVQFTENAQSYNRYAYALNNPLSYTDPTGYSLSSFFKKWIRPLVAIALTIWQPWGTGLWASMLTGGVAGYIATGKIKGALIGAFGAAVFHGIGQHFAKVAQANPKVLNFVGKTGLTPAQYAGKTLAHGLTGGVMSELNGGKFGHGFLSAGVTQLSSAKIDTIDASNTGISAQRVLAAAAVGGTVSELTGGKFANGAVTGAFSRAFNDELKHFRTRNFSKALELQVGRVAQQRRFNWESRNAYSGSHIGSYIYKSSDQYRLETQINPNQADINAGSPFPGIFSSDFQAIPDNVAGLVIAERPFSDPYLLRRQDHYMNFADLIDAPLYVIPWNYRVGDSLWRFDSRSCSYYPSGGTCR